MFHQLTTDRQSLVAPSSDEREQTKLMLYKPLASILELKKYYFHLQITPNQTTVSPYKIDPRYRGSTWNPDPLDVNPYYTPIGTTRKVDLLPIIQGISGIRCEQNRYKFQLSLETVIIEQDTTNWVKIRDDRVTTGVLPFTKQLLPTYELVNVLGAQPTSLEAGAEQDVEYGYFTQAFKKTIPQPLFVRIDELAKGDEAFHFIAQPSGVVATINGGQPIIIDQLDRFPELSITFGHMIFKGTDTIYSNDVKNELQGNTNLLNSTFDPQGISDPVVLQRLRDYQAFKYLDYNQEWYNCDDPRTIAQGGETNIGNKYVFSCGRGGYQNVTKEGVLDVPDTDEVALATRPLFSNQQASKIFFRFSVSLVPLF